MYLYKDRSRRSGTKITKNLEVKKKKKTDKSKRKMQEKIFKNNEQVYFLRSGGWPDLLMFTAADREKQTKGGGLEEVGG